VKLRRGAVGFNKCKRDQITSIRHLVMAIYFWRLCVLQKTVKSRTSTSELVPSNLDRSQRSALGQPKTIASCFIPITSHQSSIRPSSIAFISVRPASVKERKTQKVRKTHESLNGYYGTSRTPYSLSALPSAQEFAFLTEQANTHPYRTTTPPDHSSSNTLVSPPPHHVPKSGLPFSQLPLLEFHA
jgi:hypothetical protein